MMHNSKCSSTDQTIEESVVLIGTPNLKKQVDPSSPFISKLGGQPVWYQNPTRAFSKYAFQCVDCEELLYFIAQIYAPVDNLHRTLYVFGCNSEGCPNWRVYRDQCPIQMNDEKADIQPETLDTTTLSDWCLNDPEDDSWSEDESSDWTTSTEVSDDATIERLLQQLELRTNTTTTTTTGTTQKSSVTLDDYWVQPHTQIFPVSIHLDIEHEPEEVISDLCYEQQLYRDYLDREAQEEEQDQEPSGGRLTKPRGGTVSSREAYEKTPASEKYFEKYHQRLCRAPGQCLRYAYGARPLWCDLPPSPEGPPPVCPGCGQHQVFELQLLPTIMAHLPVDALARTKNSLLVTREREEPSHDQVSVDRSSSRIIDHLDVPTSMDWNHVMIYSCPESCVESREEAIFVYHPASPAPAQRT